MGGETLNILVVDDELALRQTLKRSFSLDGHKVVEVATGEAAIDRATTDPFDMVLLDVALGPGIDGYDVCRELRARRNVVPIIMLTARDAEADAVLGLEAGADDYVAKPFSMAELVSRVRAILRRRRLDRKGDTSSLHVGALTLDLLRHTVTLEGRSFVVTASELKLLALLAAQPGRVFGRREIMQHLWDSSYVGDERAADVHVKNVRRKIEHDPGRPQRLLTVRGAGYKLVAV